jgi:hypothetical protein
MLSLTELCVAKFSWQLEVIRTSCSVIISLLCQWKVRPHGEEGYRCGLYSKLSQANLQCQLWNGADKPHWENAGKKVQGLGSKCLKVEATGGVADKHELHSKIFQLTKGCRTISCWISDLKKKNWYLMTYEVINIKHRILLKSHIMWHQFKSSTYWCVHVMWRNGFTLH